MSGQKSEGDQNQKTSEMGHQEVKISGVSYFFLIVVGDDEEEGDKGHGFPGEHEKVGIIGQDHTRHRSQKKGKTQEHRSGFRSGESFEIPTGKDKNSG